MEFTPSATNTIGVEIELQLLDAESLDLRDGILPLMELFPGTPYVKPEVIQNTVEIVSRVCTSVAELEGHLSALAAEVHGKCRQLGMRLCGAGTHPFSQQLTLITPLPRYLAMEQQAGFRLHAQTTFATHVHVGVSSGDEAVALMRALKPCLPLLIALSANSPFWRGFDTGCASYRHRILAATRSYGVPPSFSDWADFCRFFETTHRAGLFESINDIHWDIRPRPHFGSLEVRAMDQQSTVADAVALASLVRVLVTWLRRVGDIPPPGLPRALPWWTEKENHFQASRLGLAARYIADEEGTVRPLQGVWEEVRAQIEPVAAELGESDRLARLCRRVETGLGHERQRRVYKETGSMQKVAVSLVEEFERETAQRAAPGVIACPA